MFSSVVICTKVGSKRCLLINFKTDLMSTFVSYACFFFRPRWKSFHGRLSEKNGNTHWQQDIIHIAWWWMYMCKRTLYCGENANKHALCSSTSYLVSSHLCVVVVVVVIGGGGYRIYPRIGRTFFQEKNVQNLGCGLYAGTRVLSSLICKISRHTQSQQSYWKLDSLIECIVWG